MCASTRTLALGARYVVGRAPVLLLVLAIAGVTNLVARDVPFNSAGTIDGAFDGAQAVFAADVDGDGDLDVLGAAAEADDIVWWQNTAGDGTAWTEHLVDGDFEGASSVFAADVDGDGDLDVLGAAKEADDVVWWENTAGDGTAWTERPVDSNFDGAISVFAADVDGDGDLDVMGTALLADDIAWWENTAGDGTAWTERAIDVAFNGARSVVAADVDSDGDLDVLGAASNADDVAWWENTAGDGTAWTEHTIDGDFNGAWSVSAVDVDGDGDTDVLGAASNANDISWWENTAGDGSAWTEHTVDGSFDRARSVFAADVDGDGDTDVLGAAWLADDITWWENTAGDGTAWTERTVDSAFDGAVSVFAADVDGDGDADVLGAAVDGDAIAWWENETIHRSAAPMVEHTVDSNFNEAVSVFAADVDGDGDLDVLGAADWADDIAWWENMAGDGTSWAEHTVDGDFNGASSVFAADVDGDGDTDVLGAARAANDISWWENTSGDGTSWTEHTVDGYFDTVSSVFAADVDGDGDTDVLGAADWGDAITWWENTSGDGTAWTEHTIDGAFYGAVSVFAADVDGDGDLDVLGASSSWNDIAWWENTAGDGSAWTERTVDGSFDGAESVFAADVDGDGDQDVLGAAQLADDIAWWENTAGDGTAWIEHTVDGSFGGARSVFAADVDGDADMDVLGAAWEADDITWWENTAGDGTAWTEHAIDGAFDGARSVFAADVDGDGDTDVLGAAKDALDISWWENRGGQFALPTADTASVTIQEEALEDLLAVRTIHRGRAGDGDVELASLELLFEETAGDPLTSAEGNALVASLRIYLDGDDSGDFGIGDPMVTSIDTLALASGVQTVQFVDGSSDVQVTHSTPRRYFVVVEMTASAGTETPSQFRLSHLTESSSTGEDAAHEIELVLEYAANVTTGVVDVVEYRTLVTSAASTGMGTVTSAPAGIDCGPTCSGRFDYGAAVTLTAVADAGSQFIGWGGDADCLDGAVTMDADLECLAYFHDQGTRDLTVTRQGSGTGTVASAPAGIDCGSTCSAPFTIGTEVTLSAVADVGSQFIGWGGDPDCSDGVVTVSLAATCVAYFEYNGPPIDLVLDSETISDTRSYEACRSITATNFDIVLPGGDVTYRTGEFAVLGEGFTVEDGCDFVVELQVPVGCL